MQPSSKCHWTVTACIKSCTMWLSCMSGMGGPEYHPVLGSDERLLFPCHLAKVHNRWTRLSHACEVCDAAHVCWQEQPSSLTHALFQVHRKEKKRSRILAIMTPARSCQVDRHADECLMSNVCMLYSLKQGRQAALAHQATNNMGFMQVPVCALLSWPLSPRYWLQLLPPFVYQRGTCSPQ